MPDYSSFLVYPDHGAQYERVITIDLQNVPLTVARLLCTIEVALQHTGGYHFLPNTPLNKTITEGLIVVVPNPEEQSNQYYT